MHGNPGEARNKRDAVGVSGENARHPLHQGRNGDSQKEGKKDQGAVPLPCVWNRLQDDERRNRNIHECVKQSDGAGTSVQPAVEEGANNGR